MPAQGAWIVDLRIVFDSSIAAARKLAATAPRRSGAPVNVGPGGTEDALE